MCLKCITVQVKSIVSLIFKALKLLANVPISINYNIKINVFRAFFNASLKMNIMEMLLFPQAI
jgi:hypothetical protein